MKVSCSWLQDYVNTSLTPSQLAEKFLMTSSEVEGVQDYAHQLTHVVIGKVEQVEPHPQADRLRVATVMADHRRTIVCGASNLEAGQTVLVALPGAKVVPRGGGELVTIQKAKIRGIESEGMICAAEELGLNLAGEGIWVLPDEYKPGTPAATALDMHDTVLDLEITPNRPDLLAYYGLAREVAAFDKRTLRMPDILSLEKHRAYAGDPIHVDIEDPISCPRYAALRLTGLTAGPSPWWLQKRLLLSGVRPINCIVDVTNYVMLELGQPLHAFDAREVSHAQGGSYIAVRSAHSGEELELLDGTVRNLEAGDIVISNQNGAAVALAGIMGGAQSGITAATQEIILESATFSGAQIRRTSRRLGLRSEASTRFEKGLDPEMAVTALKRAAFLLQEVAGAQVASSMTDTYRPSRHSRPRIHLTFDRLQHVLGVRISAQEAKGILQRLGFQVPMINKSALEAVPPTWRQDVVLPEDIIEELVRIWGYDRVPATLPSGQIKAPQPNSTFERTYRLRSVLARLGAYECIHLPFVSADDIRRSQLSIDGALALPNPLSSENAFLAPSHLPLLLRNVATVNLAEEELSLFEIGKVFAAPYHEEQRLSMLLRSDGGAENLVRYAKQVLTAITDELSLAAWEYADAGENMLTLSIQGTVVGTLQVLSADLVESWKIRRGKNIVYVELQLPTLLSLAPAERAYQPASVFPSVARDLTLVVQEVVSYGQIMEVVGKHQKSQPILQDVALADIYRGKPIPPGEKAVTLRCVYNGNNRTLTDEEVQASHEKLSRSFISTLHATINP